MATVLTNVGEQWMVDRCSGASSLNGSYVGWGTGAGTAAKADTTLFTEAAEARVSGTVSTSGTGASAKYQVVATITCAGAGKTITNAGNFDASTSGNLIVHGDFTGIALNVGDSIQFTITLDPS
jgi:hypothetical protein